MKSAQGLRRRLAVGYAVFGTLIAIKVVEYFIGTRVHSGGWAPLAVLGILAAGLICYYFMHIYQLRVGRREDD